MANIQGADSSVIAAVELAGKSLRTVIVPRGAGHVISVVTGTMAAALGANSPVFAMRLDPAAGDLRAWIDRITLQWTCLVAFGTPITVGRQLALYRGSGAATTGGASVAGSAQKHSAASQSEFNLATGGDIRIATTAALVDAGITWETNPLGRMGLVHRGNAGDFMEQVFDFAADHHEVILEPGQLLGIRNPQAMDATGTWELHVEVQYREAKLLTSAS